LKLVKAIVKTHFKNYSCNEFYSILLKDNKLLDAISSAQKKYAKTAEEEIDLPPDRHRNKIVFDV